MFYVIFEDEGKLRISDKAFDHVYEALVYAHWELASRKSRVVRLAVSVVQDEETGEYDYVWEQPEGPTSLEGK